MRTLKEFKAFIKTRPTLELVEYHVYNATTKTFVPANHKFKYKPRRVVETNSVGFMFEGFSEMRWPCKDELKEWDVQHIVIETEYIRLTYEIK